MTFFDIFGRDAVFPSGSAVLDSEPSFGRTGSEIDPSYHAPDASEVLNSAVFGANSAIVGLVAQASTSDVRQGTAYGASNNLVGTLVVSSGGGVDHSEQLDRIENNTSRMYVGQVQFNDPVSVGGVVTLYKGSDYKEPAGTALRIDFADTGAAIRGRLINSTQTTSIIFGAGRCSANEITGTAATSSTSHSEGITTVLVEIDSSAIENTEPRDDYEYHLKAISPDGFESVFVSNELRVKDERARV